MEKYYNYVDSCTTYTVLLQDSGLLPKPKEDWNTFVPQKGMVAHVDEDDSNYVFDGTKWVKMVEEEEAEVSTSPEVPTEEPTVEEPAEVESQEEVEEVSSEEESQGEVE